MIPETSEINEIRIYECIEFPLKWKFKMTIMKGVDAGDSIVLKRDGFWFLLTNICSVNSGDHNSELHIFYSNDIFSFPVLQYFAVSRWRVKVDFFKNSCLQNLHATIFSLFLY